MITMPFGEYKGRSLDSLPAAYLVFITSKELPPPLRTGIEQEILRRLNVKPARASRVRMTPSYDVVDELIEAGRRSQARRYHPDAGGTHEDMVRVNDAADWLRDQVRRVA